MSLGQIALYLIVGGLALLGLAALLSLGVAFLEEWSEQKAAHEAEIREALAYYQAAQRLDAMHGEARDAIIQRVIKR